MIGIDAATFDLINPWINDLPNLKKLIGDGASGELFSRLPITAAAWTSAATGKNPGKHGLFEFTERMENSYFDLQPVDSKDRKCDAVWNILSREKKKVIVVHYPMTYPPEEVNGIMVSDVITTPSITSNFAYPPDIKIELMKQITDFRITINEMFKDGSGKEDIYLSELMKLTESQKNTALYLMKKYEWEFFFIEIHAVDLVCHFFWKYMDKTHPNHDPELEKKYGSAIFQIYKNVDDVVGKLLQNITDDVSVIVMSDHGVGPLYKYVYFNNFLLDKGLMKIKGGFLPQLKYWLFKNGFTVDNCLKIIPRKTILYLLGNNKKNNKTDTKDVGKIEDTNKEKRRKRLSIPNPFLSYSDVDWSQTKAYSIGFISPIYINLMGREPHGIIQKGDEYKKIVGEVINELNYIKDSDTNEKIFDYALTKEVFSGKYSNKAPDIAVIMKDMAYIGRDVNAYYPPFFSAFRTNKLMEPSVIQDISGTHRMNGIVILKGNNIKEKFIIKGAEIEDIAPTILYLMDLKIPKDMDGKVLIDAFEPHYTKDKPVIYTDMMEEKNEKDSIAFSKDDETKIKERLRNLGYLS